MNTETFARLSAIFAALRAVAVEQKITATNAVRHAMMEVPEATRVEIKHAAIAAGINKFTARNTYDKVMASITVVTP